MSTWVAPAPPRIKPIFVPVSIKPQRLRMSYEEYLRWADEDVHTEWVDGEVIVHMPPKTVHQKIAKFLSDLLGLFVRLFRLGELYTAPFEMKLWPGGPSREPDILFIANENLNRLTEDRLEGSADLVIEIVSDDSIHRDRNEKFREYSKAGVREYWIIDPRPKKQWIDCFQRNEQGEYELFATEDSERVESRVVPGFWLRPEWLWQADSLDPLTAFFEMRGISVEQAEQMRQLLRGEQAGA